MIGLAAVGSLVAWLITDLIRRNAGRLQLVQVPNQRSSHSVPTPSGGGASIAVVGTLAGFLLVWNSAQPYLNVAISLSAVAALIGLLDDRFDLSSRLRLALQFAVIAALISSVGTLPTAATPFGPLPQPVLFLAVGFYGVWWVNLFNFMDGIDGIAGTEAIFVLLGAVGICMLTDSPLPYDPTFWWAICIAMATAGFLLLNWPPARIFMGDAGSNYLAVAIFAILLALIALGWLSYPPALILCALFVVDASVTLVRRMYYGERWFGAHRLHAYQKLSRRWVSHRRVTLLYTGINLVYLYPLAHFAQSAPEFAWILVVFAYLPLVGLSVAAGAGKPDPRSPSQKDNS